MTTETLEQTAERIVRQEVRACVSYLVATLAGNYGSVRDLINRETAADLQDLSEQAFELAAPIPDYEEAAIQAGWTQSPEGWLWREPREGEVADFYFLGSGPFMRYDNINDLIKAENLKPYKWEVFKHWIVSDWLADKLLERGEKVDKDFAGLCVWARTTSGQMIAMDSVIEAIAKQVQAG